MLVDYRDCPVSLDSGRDIIIINIVCIVVHLLLGESESPKFLASNPSTLWIGLAYRRPIPSAD